jgi:threonine dehydrogenase-like Zn-dependent dehydrogenase
MRSCKSSRATVGTAFFGGPKECGPVQPLHAERARILFANVGLVKLLPSVSAEQATLILEIFPTCCFGAVKAQIEDGDAVAAFGCGPNLCRPGG